MRTRSIGIASLSKLVPTSSLIRSSVSASVGSRVAYFCVSILGSFDCWSVFPVRSKTGMSGLGLLPVFPDPPIWGSETDRLASGFVISGDFYGVAFPDKVPCRYQAIKRFCRAFFSVLARNRRNRIMCHHDCIVIGYGATCYGP